VTSGIEGWVETFIKKKKGVKGGGGRVHRGRVSEGSLISELTEIGCSLNQPKMQNNRGQLGPGAKTGEEAERARVGVLLSGGGESEGSVSGRGGPGDTLRVFKEAVVKITRGTLRSPKRKRERGEQSQREEGECLMG